MTRQGGSAEHILSHLKEKYYVPSLLARTLDTMPTSQVMRWAVAEKWDPQFKAHSGGNGGWGQDYAYQQLQKNLGRYLLRQLGRAA